jgi:hypothetical protein
MTLNAPKDKKTSRARLNWLLRQLKAVDPAGINIGVIWASRAQTLLIPLADFRESPEKIEGAAKSANIRAFEITMTSNSARRFVGRRTFIEDLEHLVPSFYEQIGQNLRAWTPSPPKPLHTVDEAEASPTPKVIPQAVAQPGNAHGELLEVPMFLRRNNP